MVSSFTSSYTKSIDIYTHARSQNAINMRKRMSIKIVSIVYWIWRHGSVHVLNLVGDSQLLRDSCYNRRKDPATKSLKFLPTFFFLFTFFSFNGLWRVGLFGASCNIYMFRTIHTVNTEMHSNLTSLELFTRYHPPFLSISNDQALT